MNGNESGCPVYKKCSGCSLRNMSYEEQLRFKFIKVDRLLGKMCRPDRIIGMDSPEGCRCKVQGAFDFKKGKVLSGVYQSATGSVIDVQRCPVNDERADRIILAVKKTALRLKIPFWCSYTKTGFLRNVLVRIGKNTGEIMAVIVGSAEAFPSKKAFAGLLAEKCPEITTAVFAVNKGGKMTSGFRYETLFGKGYIEDIVCGKRFRISPGSFAQVNPVQAEKIYRLALELSGIRENDTVIDAYCGTGIISILAAQRAGTVYGCEISSSAVKDAVINARLNNVENVSFVCADSGDFLAGFNAEGLRADIVILDPARAGCDRKFISELAKASPRRIVYISCNPEAMARDVFALVKSGYKLKRLIPVDMFPFTAHIECVGLLVRANG